MTVSRLQLFYQNLHFSDIFVYIYLKHFTINSIVTSSGHSIGFIALFIYLGHGVEASFGRTVSDAAPELHSI